MDSWEAAERARLAETFLFRGAPPEAWSSPDRPPHGPAGER